MKYLHLTILSITLFSCKKENLTQKDFTISPSAWIWNSNTQTAAKNIDSVRFQFYNRKDTTLLFVTYTDINGKCSVTLKGDTDYDFKCYSPTYKDSDNKLYHYASGDFIHSTKFQTNTKSLPNDFIVTFEITKNKQKGKGTTTNVRKDPAF